MLQLYYTRITPEASGENNTKQKARLSARTKQLHDAAHGLLRCALDTQKKGASGKGKARKSKNTVNTAAATDTTQAPALITGEYGKPYLKELPELFFSLSHSETVAVCAISDREIGIDIEYHREMSPDRLLRIAKRFFAPEEYDAIAEESGEAAKELFYRIWTAKEAYIKFTGEGMHRNLASFSVVPVKDSMVTGDRILAHFRHVDIIGDYSLCLCSGELFQNDLHVRRL